MHRVQGRLNIDNDEMIYAAVLCPQTVLFRLLLTELKILGATTSR
jgi:hypothetical protein